MTVYVFLRRYLPPWLAGTLLVLWYALLLLLVLRAAWLLPEGEFRYGDL